MVSRYPRPTRYRPWGAVAVKRFSSAARTTQIGSNLGELGLKTGIKTNTETSIQQFNDLVMTAAKQAPIRLKNANAVIKERVKEIPDQLAKQAIGAGRVMDETVTNTKTFFGNLNVKTAPAYEGVATAPYQATNTHFFENEITGVVKRFKGVNIGGMGVSNGAGKNIHRSEIDEVIKNDYDINGNLVNRSMVPKGYESVEDFLKVVDDRTIKEFGYDSIEEFKAVVGHVDDYLNALPKNNIVNKGLAGGRHMEGVDYDVLGFPIFKGDNLKFTLKLDEKHYVMKDTSQFKECTRILKEAIERGEVPKSLFTLQQLDQI